MIVCHQKKKEAINTNIAMFANNTLLGIDLIAALAGLLSWRRTSHHQRSRYAELHCAVVFSLYSPDPSEASLALPHDRLL